MRLTTALGPIITALAFALVMSAGLSEAGDDGKGDDQKMGVHHSAEPGLGQSFAQALDAGDEKRMRGIIAERTDDVPDEVIAIVQYAVSAKPDEEEQDGLFNVAGIMAQMYAEQTGDERLLNGVRVNYQEVLKRRKGDALPPATVDKTKKELAELGEGNWRVTIFELDENGDLNIEIGVRGDAKGSTMTPRIDIATSEKAKSIVVGNLPNVKNGAISWSSMGVGLKTVFIGEGRKR